jgi:hypothetical protein
LQGLNISRWTIGLKSRLGGKERPVQPDFGHPRRRCLRSLVSSSSTRVEFREYRLKLTPPRSSAAPKGALRPVTALPCLTGSQPGFGVADSTCDASLHRSPPVIALAAEWRGGSVGSLLPRCHNSSNDTGSLVPAILIPVGQNAGSVIKPVRGDDVNDKPLDRRWPTRSSAREPCGT